ncbi:hypothetical protein A2714_04905 [Candidatus Woesebacteria bacterium RIFCSPHIGHO2_01_FULL_38_9]|uniref:Uncharacterized protein n=2 Tax=Candidatus Woeseibacteriota TaxID=1752722 RepID=A0A1F7Y1F6_9BACT|nr:MAG: hypothetical protein A2714_04905 [Candidatus Woesebacteria bacterium RIFCSPHIGHO2_01_FULL_38_9]OGM58808.1 MAG: hypothetical protein A3A75_00255 [Candidatus Woesebacteria bacterium RIFCSPLOWO2_01_FULL_39_10]
MGFFAERRKANSSHRLVAFLILLTILKIVSNPSEALCEGGLKGISNFVGVLFPSATYFKSF